MGLTGWAIYETACNLVGGIGSPSTTRQIQFNATLFQYFLIFTGLGVLISTVIHYYLTKKLIKPIRELVQSTKILKQGKYPSPVKRQSSGEMEELIDHYNELIARLKQNDEDRKKLIENISHELRTPTANIKGYLYALREGDIEGDKRLFDSLHNQADQLSMLIEQIEWLQLSDNEGQQTLDQKEWVAIEQIIEESVQLFEWQIKEEKITLTKEIEQTEVKVYKNGMQQVLSNVLENAIRYRIHKSPITIIGKKESSGYKIQICGKGESIPETEREQIFDRFYRIDHSRNRSTGGSGLGLAIAKEIMMNHKGSIHLSSNNNHHTFTIFIPEDKR